MCNPIKSYLLECSFVSGHIRFGTRVGPAVSCTRSARRCRGEMFNRQGSSGIQGTVLGTSLFDGESQNVGIFLHVVFYPSNSCFSFQLRIRDQFQSEVYCRYRFKQRCAPRERSASGTFRGFLPLPYPSIFISIYVFFQKIFRNLHMLYTDAVCNPFYIPGEQLTSK